MDEPSPQKTKRSYFRSKDYHESIYNSKYNSTLQQQLRKLDTALLKVVVVLEATEHEKIVEHRMAEIEIYENSSFPELASNALRKLNLRQTERNLALMKEQIRTKVEGFLRQLNKAVRQIERQRTFERSYLAVLKK